MADRLAVLATNSVGVPRDRSRGAEPTHKLCSTLQATGTQASPRARPEVFALDVDSDACDEFDEERDVDTRVPPQPWVLDSLIPLPPRCDTTETLLLALGGTTTKEEKKDADTQTPHGGAEGRDAAQPARSPRGCASSATTSMTSSWRAREAGTQTQHEGSEGRDAARPARSPRGMRL